MGPENGERINVLVCEHNFIFYDDGHWLLALLATGSDMPVLYLSELTTEGTEQDGSCLRRGGWLLLE